MYDRERRIYAWNLEYLTKLIADVDDEGMAKRPAPGINPAIWILGHLTIATDYARRQLGLGRACPKEWHVDFGPGTVPLEGKRPYPSKAELVEAHRKGHEEVSAAAANARPEDLDRPHEIDFLLSRLPTKGDLLAHLMTSHEATHVGQLSAWRRLCGLPPVNLFD